MDNSDLAREIIELKRELAELRNHPVSQPNLWERIKANLSTQGSQRGLIAIIPFAASRLDLSPEELLAILTFSLGIMGIQNILTEG